MWLCEDDILEPGGGESDDKKDGADRIEMASVLAKWSVKGGKAFTSVGIYSKGMCRVPSGTSLVEKGKRRSP
jgi:hypothetical protein